MTLYLAKPMTSFPRGFEVGDRVRVTTEYTKQFVNLRSNKGTIIGGSRDQGCCRVQLDGYKNALVLSFRFLRREP